MIFSCTILGSPNVALVERAKILVVEVETLRFDLVKEGIIGIFLQYTKLLMSRGGAIFFSLNRTWVLSFM